MVRVDSAALLRGYAGDGETCAIAGVGPVPVATVRELWPDAVVKAVVTRGVDVLNVTSLGRRATEAMETAMCRRNIPTTRGNRRSAGFVGHAPVAAVSSRDAADLGLMHHQGPQDSPAPSSTTAVRIAP